MIWDRSRPWCIERHEVNLRHVRVQFAAARPTIEEVAAVRKAFPEFAHIAPAALLAQLGDCGQLDLGERLSGDVTVHPRLNGSIVARTEEAGAECAH